VPKAEDAAELAVPLRDHVGDELRSLPRRSRHHHSPGIYRKHASFWAKEGTSRHLTPARDKPQARKHLGPLVSSSAVLIQYRDVGSSNQQWTFQRVTG
jgi:hypothetical protein